jgi:hypothetical protein
MREKRAPLGSIVADPSGGNGRSFAIGEIRDLIERPARFQAMQEGGGDGVTRSHGIGSVNWIAERIDAFLTHAEKASTGTASYTDCTPSEPFSNPACEFLMGVSIPAEHSRDDQRFGFVHFHGIALRQQCEYQLRREISLAKVHIIKALGGERRDQLPGHFAGMSVHLKQGTDADPVGRKPWILEFHGVIRGGPMNHVTRLPGRIDRDGHGASRSIRCAHKFRREPELAHALPREPAAFVVAYRTQERDLVTQAVRLHGEVKGSSAEPLPRIETSQRSSPMLTIFIRSTAS